MNVIDVEDEVAVWVVVAGELTTLNDVMLLPLLDGVLHCTVALVELATTVAEPIVGVLGVVNGVTEELEDEYEPIPAEFTAATRNV